MFQDDKITLTWSSPRVLMPKNRVKLLLNLVMLATNAIPRGGSIDVTVIVGEGDEPSFTLSARGLNARIPAHSEALLRAEPESGVVDAHAIQIFYTGLVARAAEMAISMSIEGDTVVISAERG
jgi:histidine phosphotransferase ChpT